MNLVDEVYSKTSTHFEWNKLCSSKIVNLYAIIADAADIKIKALLERVE